MRFSKYVDKTWDAKNFCHLLAAEARRNFYDNLYKNYSEMAMGTQEVDDPKQPILHDADDYKFLSQFPYNVWSDAINWRYNAGLREMMRSKDPTDITHIPDGWNWTDKLVLPGSRKHKFYIFGKQGGPRNIYIGLTDLAKKLTSPPKGQPHSKTYDPRKPGSDELHPHWAGDGPSLSEIDPSHTDPEHPAHPSKYKHGLYNFDLNDMAEVTDEDIDNIPDQDIQAYLGGKLADAPVDSDEVQAAIKRIRGKMKDVKKHTFSSYTVPQTPTSQKNMSDWITANALELFGTHPPTYADPLDIDPITKKPRVHVIGSTKPEELNKHPGYGLTVKKDHLEPGTYTLKHSIPTIKRKLSFVELDNKNNTITDKSGEYTIPFLNPQKVLPQLHKGSPVDLTNAQRAALAKRTNPAFDWNPDTETMDEAEARFNKISPKLGASFVDATRPGELKTFLKNWDLWTQEQKDFIKANARSLHHVARHVFGKSDGTDDPYADPLRTYAAGPRPNFLTQGQGALNVPEDKMGEFIKEYYPKMMFELIGDRTEGAGEGYESKGKIDRFLDSMQRNGRHPPQVIKALRAKDTELATFAAYNLLTWLNDPRYGIKDDRFNLLKDYKPEDIDEEGNAIRRGQKVEWFLLSAAQIGFNDVLSRRHRKNFGVGTTAELSAANASGKSSEGEVEEGAQKLQGKVQHIDLPAKRRWLHSDQTSIARRGQKLHKVSAQAPEFFTLRRRQILQRLGKVPQVEADLKSAEKKIQDAIELSIEVYQKYDDELKATIPNEEKREPEVLKHVAEALKKHASFSDMEIEDVVQRTKTLASVNKPSAHDIKLKETMDKWMDDFMHLSSKESMKAVVWNPQMMQAVQTGGEVGPSKLPPTAHAVAQMIAMLFEEPKLILGALKQWGFQAYQKVVDIHDEIDKTDEELQADWQAEMSKWESKFSQESKMAQQQQQQPTQMPQQPQAVAQPQAQAAKALSQPLPELFGMANTINSTEDMLKLGNALLSKKAEMLATPGSAQQLRQVLNTIKQRRPLFAKGLPPKEEYLLFNKQLPEILGELEHAHHS